MFCDVKLPLGLNLLGNNLETQLYVEFEQINLSMIYLLLISPLKREEIKEFGGHRKDVTNFSPASLISNQKPSVYSHNSCATISAIHIPWACPDCGILSVKG